VVHGTDTTKEQQLPRVELLTARAVVAAQDGQHGRLEFRRMPFGLRGSFLMHAFDELREGHAFGGFLLKAFLERRALGKQVLLALGCLLFALDEAALQERRIIRQRRRVKMMRGVRAHAFIDPRASKKFRLQKKNFLLRSESTRTSFGEVETRQQPQQLLARDLDGHAVAARPAERAALQPLVVNRQAVLIVPEDLEQVSAAVAKDKQATTQGIVAEECAHHFG
jgi:hypothetical protein